MAANPTLKAFLRRRLDFRAKNTRAAEKVEKAVRKILLDVQKKGDAAVLRYTAKWDRARLPALRVTDREFDDAARQVEPRDRRILEFAVDRFRRFYEAQKMRGAPFVDETGYYSERVAPLDRVGLYVPGGRAPLVSTALMLSVPAAVAGVRERYIATPPQPNGAVPSTVLLAARLSGATAVFKMGGAQAIGALAYGTKTVPAVDKIFGPGNIYVTVAKKMVYGAVGIDMLAGPSELVVIADDSADAEQVAADLLAQAEHGPGSLSILLTTSEALDKKVRSAIGAEKALAKQIFSVVLNSPEDCAAASAGIAPEHLSLAVAEPEKLLPLVGPAGAIFLGHSAVAHGDYIAGPNHTLPTAGAARYASALSIESFFRRSSVLNVRDPDGELGRVGARLAEIEGLTHHARSLRLRGRRS